jgi:quercetin dioxygenase-like cupin family protein
MNRSIKLMAAVSLALFAAAALRADAPKLPGMDDPIIVDPTSLQWKPAPEERAPKGTMVSPVSVDPQTKASVGYTRIPGGSVFPMHSHSYTDYSTLIAGKMTYTFEGKKHELIAGSYFVAPPKAPHALTCEEGNDCILLTRRAGPVDYIWVEK